MSRITPDEAKAIVSTSLGNSVLQVWIDAANAVVNHYADEIGGDEALLGQVELFLSAHFVAMLDPKLRGFVTKEKLEVFEKTYSNPVTIKNNIDGTPYGETANRLSNGVLASSSDKVARVDFL